MLAAILRAFRKPAPAPRPEFRSICDLRFGQIVEVIQKPEGPDGAAEPLITIKLMILQPGTMRIPGIASFMFEHPEIFTRTCYVRDAEAVRQFRDLAPKEGEFLTVWATDQNGILEVDQIVSKGFGGHKVPFQKMAA